MTGNLQHQYTGRFAPTPSGPLHFGSIVTALASYLQARQRQGRWFVRIDDLDTPRVHPGATDAILRSLERLSLHWDGEVLYQHGRREAYQHALEQLLERGLLYRCDCPRRETRGMPYPGTCRDRLVPSCNPAALRIRTDNSLIEFDDLIQGRISEKLLSERGDFIVYRADGFHAYPLAVVVDDAWQGVTEIIRGADLLDATAEHLWIYRQLGLEPPVYGHVPVVLGADGKKLGKSDAALDALIESEPATVLMQALRFLGQTVNTELTGAGPAEIIEAAISTWDITQIRRIRGIYVTHSVSDTPHAQSSHPR